jgi:hypothetical protein
MATQKKTKSNEKLKYGDTREDGYRFWGYYYRTSKTGVRKLFENWASPSSFLRIRKSSVDSARKNKLKYPKKNKEQAKRWRIRNPEKCKNARLKKEFGISIDEYYKKLAKQKKVCAICSKSCSSGKNLAVDHCHTSGRIRGLLCGKCNLGLGLFKDDVILLDTAKKYLLKYRKSLCENQEKSPLKS